MKKTTITLNKKEYNKVMNLVHQIKESTKGQVSVNEFIKMYETMKEITTDTCAIDELVWGDYYANEYFENTADEQLYDLYTTYSKAIGFIEYWTWEYKELYNELTTLTYNEHYWIEEDFEQFTTLD
jgi:hypothetical protein